MAPGKLFEERLDLNYLIVERPDAYIVLREPSKRFTEAVNPHLHSAKPSDICSRAEPKPFSRRSSPSSSISISLTSSIMDALPTILFKPSKTFIAAKLLDLFKARLSGKVPADIAEQIKDHKALPAIVVTPPEQDETEPAKNSPSDAAFLAPPRKPRPKSLRRIDQKRSMDYGFPKRRRSFVL